MSQLKYLHRHTTTTTTTATTTTTTSSTGLLHVSHYLTILTATLGINLSQPWLTADAHPLLIPNLSQPSQQDKSFIPSSVRHVSSPQSDSHNVSNRRPSHQLARKILLKRTGRDCWTFGNFWWPFNDNHPTVSKHQRQLCVMLFV